jgi:hypothetical protein
MSLCNARPHQRLHHARALLAAAAALTFAGCAFVPPRNLRLEEASNAYGQVAADWRVSSLARPELMRARQTLDDAIAARDTLQDPAAVDHLAYLARQRAAIALELARQRASAAY